MDYRGWLRHHHLSRGTPAPDTVGPADERRLRVLLAAVAMSIFAVQLDFFALNLSLPDMANQLGVSTTDIQWVISGYMLALGAFLVPGGRLGDLIGRRRMLLAGLGIFGGSSLIGGLAPSAELLIGCRVLQGVGGAILFPVAIAVISNAYPPERQMRAIGNAYGLGAIATALGPFAGGALTELIDWRAVLLINVPITALAAFLVLRSVSESRDETVPRSIDFPGLLLVVAGIAAVTFAVDRSEQWGWVSAETLGLIAAGLALLGAFVLRERAARHPLVSLALFANRPYVGVTLIGTIANVGFVVATFSVTLYLQRVEGYSAAEAGLLFLAASLPLAFTGPLSGWLGERFDIPRAMVVGTILGAGGLVVLSTGPGLGLYVLGMAMFGGGYGLGWSMASVGTQAVVAPERAGQASGVTLAMLIGLGGLAIAVAASLIETIAADGVGLGPAIEDVLRYVGLGTAALAPALLLVARERAGEAGAR